MSTCLLPLVLLDVLPNQSAKNLQTKEEMDKENEAKHWILNSTSPPII